MAQYTIGLDFGTLSSRALLVELSLGREVACREMDYPHGVLDEQLPNGRKLQPGWALQDPRDYIQVLETVVKGVMEDSGARPEEVVGLGVDFTASTVMPVAADGTPLSFFPEYSDNPHAYAKLWKHHGAVGQAERLTRLAGRCFPDLLRKMGGQLSAEGAIPKLLELYENAPEIYHQMDSWVEAADWITWQLTGRLTANSCAAGYKALYCQGYPQKLLDAVEPGFSGAGKKLCRDVIPLGQKAGELTVDMAERLGLQPGTPVAAANVDAHACVPGAGVDGPGKLLMILGTSACFMLVDEKLRAVEGICGVVKDGMIPGFWGYEAGQSCMGDHYAWFAKHCCPRKYAREAEKQGMDLQAYLTEKAAQLKPGQSGLMALDWWNGNRSILEDADLSGLILGMDLQTRPEEIYRALLEATAYGARMILENFRRHGLRIAECIACGGISRKNPLVMQIYADVLGIPIAVAESVQTAALGSAIFAAVAAGAYPDVSSAVSAMTRRETKAYQPIAANTATYEKLFAHYRRLHDYFGRGENNVMKDLKALRRTR